MVRTYRPDSLKEALDILDSGDVYIFAGGTDLMVKKRSWSGIPPCFENDVLFISNIKELNNISENEDFYIIGAGVTCAQIGESKILPKYIKEVFMNMAAPGIRNLATIGGNIGNSSPAGDSLPLLYSLDSNIVLLSKNSQRNIKVEDYIIGPGKNIRKKEELIKEIIIPKGKFNFFKVKKVGTRLSTALSKLSFTGFSLKEEGKVLKFRVSFGAVGPTVIRNTQAERETIEELNKEKYNISKILEIYSPLIKPIDDQRSEAKYRKEVSLRILKEFIEEIMEEK